MSAYTFKGKTVAEWRLTFAGRWADDGLRDLAKAAEYGDRFASSHVEMAIRAFRNAATHANRYLDDLERGR